VYYFFGLHCIYVSVLIQLQTHSTGMSEKLLLFFGKIEFFKQGVTVHIKSIFMELLLISLPATLAQYLQ